MKERMKTIIVCYWWNFQTGNTFCNLKASEDDYISNGQSQ